MFLCKDCLEKNYLVETQKGFKPWSENSWLGLPSYYGPCEDCHKETSCYDIHHSKIAHKDSQHVIDKIIQNESKVTLSLVDRIIREYPNISYTIDEYGYFSVHKGQDELLTFFPVAGGRSGYRIIYSDFSDNDKNIEGTFKKEVDGVKFFYNVLTTMLCNK